MIRKMIALAGLTAFLFVAARPAISATGSTDVSSPANDGTLKALTAVAGAGTMDTHTYQYLSQLSDDIGARVTGSPEAGRAIEWGVEKMKAIGLENVHTEPWELSRGWTRISADAEIESPIHRRVMIDAMGWVGSTAAGGADADVVEVNSYQLEQEMKDNAGKWRGKVLLMVQKGDKPKNGMSMFAKFGDFLKTAHQAGAVAVIGGQGGSKSQGMNLTHTGILGFDTDFAIPVVSMTAEDQGQLERLIARGLTPRMRIDVQNTLTSGPVETANVVGEIRGTEHPEQILVVGGHLDSWDLAQGATDNGSGTATTLGAAEAIMRSGQKPRRTIRFVLFTGEEQGLDGSFAYMKQHAAEIPNHVGDLILDEGQGPVTDFMLGGRDDLVTAFQPFASWLANLRTIKVNDKVESGTDTLPFSIAGLPGINMNQETSDYKYTHHSAADALEAQKPDVLTQNATLMALTAFWIADRPERLAAPWPAERTARMLHSQGEYEELKAFHIWPFGDLGSDERPRSKH